MDVTDPNKAPTEIEALISGARCLVDGGSMMPAAESYIRRLADALQSATAGRGMVYPANIPHDRASIIAAMEQGVEALRRCIRHDHSQTWAQEAFEKLVDTARALGDGT